MATKTPPAFQFYASDWLGSTRIALMLPEQEGAYIRLLAHEWADPDCSLPDNDQQLAQLSRLGARWKKLKVEILACFEAHPERPDRLINPKLYAVRRAQQRLSEQGRRGGTKSANSRWGRTPEGEPGGKPPRKPNGKPSDVSRGVSHPVSRSSANGSAEPSAAVQASPEANRSAEGNPPSPTPREVITGIAQQHRVQGSKPPRRAGPVETSAQDDWPERRLTIVQVELIGTLRELTGESDRVGYYRRLVTVLPEATVRRIGAELREELQNPSVHYESPGKLLTTIAKRIAADIGVPLFEGARKVA